MIIVRAARFPEDLKQLQRLSPPEFKAREEFFIYPTLVADLAGCIVGYTQFSLGPDKILHSLAIRIDSEFKGLGIGRALMVEKVKLARAAGARMHLYAVAKDGEVALKKILLKIGMHLCKDGDPQIYAEHFDAL